MKVFIVLAANKFFYSIYEVCAVSECGVYENECFRDELDKAAVVEYNAILSSDVLSDDEEPSIDQYTYKIISCEEVEEDCEEVEEDCSEALKVSGFRLLRSGGNG